MTTTELELRRGYEEDGMSEAEIERALDAVETAAEAAAEMLPTDSFEIESTNIGSINVDDGHDQYVLLKRKDDDLTTEQAIAWVLPRVFHNTNAPGAYYCTWVRAMQKPNSDSEVICIIEHRYNI